jgi:hypothetical protein
MDQPPSSELDLIQDPETGLALLAKRPDEETPEQRLERYFWQAQFTLWRNWRAGDVQAISDAVICCALSKRSPPPWLCIASLELWERNISAGEKRECGDLIKHFLRWEAVELVRGRRPWSRRNYKRKIHGDAVWEEATKLVAGTIAEANAGTVKKSHALIKRAGGALVTLQSYKREVEERYRRRKEKK